MKKPTGPVFGLHGLRHNKVDVVTSHGLIHFPHLTIQVKRANCEVSAKPQLVFSDENLKNTPMTTKSVCRWCCTNDQWNCSLSVLTRNIFPTRELHKVAADKVCIFKLHAGVLGPSCQGWPSCSISEPCWNCSQDCYWFYPWCSYSLRVHSQSRIESMIKNDLMESDNLNSLIGPSRQKEIHQKPKVFTNSSTSWNSPNQKKLCSAAEDLWIHTRNISQGWLRNSTPLLATQSRYT